MEKQLLAEHWTEIRQHILRSWGHRITGRDLDTVKGDKDGLRRLLQERCELDERLANRQLERFLGAVVEAIPAGS